MCSAPRPCFPPAAGCVPVDKRPVSNRKGTANGREWREALRFRSREEYSRQFASIRGWTDRAFQQVAKLSWPVWEASPNCRRLVRTRLLWCSAVQIRDTTRLACWRRKCGVQETGGHVFNRRQRSSTELLSPFSLFSPVQVLAAPFVNEHRSRSPRDDRQHQVRGVVAVMENALLGRQKFGVGPEGFAAVWIPVETGEVAAR